MDDPRHSSTLKGTHLSRLTDTGDGLKSIGNSTTLQSDATKRFHGGLVSIKKIPPPPPLPDNHQGMEEDHHQQQMQIQQERSPPKQLPDMLQHQAMEQGFQNLDGKEPILDILQQAGLQIEDLDQQSIDELPTWSQIQSLYGNEPRILGLETCAAFREGVDAKTRFFGVAGTFNSGTNLGKNTRVCCHPRGRGAPIFLNFVFNVLSSCGVDGQELSDY